MKQVLFFVSFVGLWFAGAARCAGPAPSPTAEQVRFFENRIRPLLADRCLSCHGPDKQRGRLRLDSADGLRKGGASGSALTIRGKPESSLLIRVVRHDDDLPHMPPKEKLKDAQIADLVRWVKMGAPYPAAAVRAARPDRHWAFQLPVAPIVPAVKDQTWARSPVDRFLLAALERKGLRPAPPADARTLIRRVTFDLTGLPPTPEEVDAFLADRSPDAFERLVDRMLASPAYGERWGRHWLDVARYADSNGLDENVAHGNAWRYRDHVVAAFNRDQPYDDFLLDQIAGDLLTGGDESRRRERLIATGFLSLGPKVLAEVDERKMELDIVDEQADTLGRAVLALTVGCARCHDHKFDPLSAEDYYGLAGIFLSTRTMEKFTKVARWYEVSLASPEDLRRKRDYDAVVARRKLEIDAIRQKANAGVRAGARPGAALPKNLEPLYPPEVRQELSRLRTEITRLEKTAPEIPSAMGVGESKTTDAPLLRRGNHLNPGRPVKRRFPTFLAGEKQPSLPDGQSGRLELARWLVHKGNPLTARVMVNRLWRWHFGQGLVRSVDNFGLLGEKPTHPELLDWLALRFRDGGWSIKAVHRFILLSNAYRMSSAQDERSATLDPDNRLLWRMPVRRLEAEAIRDSILAVGDGLDRTMGGSLLHVKNREYLFDHTSRDRTAYDAPRRSLYLPVIRNNLYDVFQLFDATDATVGSGDRATTTVATQALFLMNSELVRQAAARLADDLLARTGDDQGGRLRHLYVKAYGRPPTPRETERAGGILTAFEESLRDRQPDSGKRRLEAWTWLCHTVLAANEFIYVN